VVKRSDTTGIIDAKNPHPGGVAAMAFTTLQSIIASADPAGTGTPAEAPGRGCHPAGVRIITELIRWCRPAKPGLNHRLRCWQAAGLREWHPQPRWQPSNAGSGPQGSFPQGLSLVSLNRESLNNRYHRDFAK